MKIYEATKVIGKLPRDLRDIVMASRDIELMTLTGSFQLDISNFDDNLTKNDTEYDNVNCTYKGKNVNVGEYIKLKWGESSYVIIQSLL